MEAHGFRLSKSKMEYMKCMFSRRHTNSSLEVKIGDYTIPQVTLIKYLRPMMQNDGEIEGDINYRI